MRDALRKKERWKGRRALTQDPSTNLLLSRSLAPPLCALLTAASTFTELAAPALLLLLPVSSGLRCLPVARPAATTSYQDHHMCVLC